LHSCVSVVWIAIYMPYPEQIVASEA